MTARKITILVDGKHVLEFEHQGVSRIDLLVQPDGSVVAHRQLPVPHWDPKWWQDRWTALPTRVAEEGDGAPPTA